MSFLSILFARFLSISSRNPHVGFILSILFARFLLLIFQAPPYVNKYTFNSLCEIPIIKNFLYDSLGKLLSILFARFFDFDSKDLAAIYEIFQFSLRDSLSRSRVEEKCHGSFQFSLRDSEVTKGKKLYCKVCFQFSLRDSQRSQPQT